MISEICFVPGNYSLSYDDAKVQPQQLSERFSYKREDTNEYRNGKEFDSFSGITFQKLFNAKEIKICKVHTCVVVRSSLICIFCCVN